MPDLDWTALGLIAAEEAGFASSRQPPQFNIACSRPAAQDHEEGKRNHAPQADTFAQHGACRHPRHIAQGVARRDRHLGYRRLDVGRNR